MNINYLKNKNIHFVECENWHDTYGYEKSQMKEDTINYIAELQQETQKLQERIEYLERSNDRREDTVLEQRQKINDLEDNWNKLEDLIYEVICDIESDFDNKLTVHDIYKKLVKVREITRDTNKELETAFEDLL